MTLSKSRDVKKFYNLVPILITWFLLCVIGSIFALRGERDGDGVVTLFGGILILLGFGIGFSYPYFWRD